VFGELKTVKFSLKFKVSKVKVFLNDSSLGSKDLLVLLSLVYRDLNSNLGVRGRRSILWPFSDTITVFVFTIKYKRLAYYLSGLKGLYLFSLPFNSITLLKLFNPLIEAYLLTKWGRII